MFLYNALIITFRINCCNDHPNERCLGKSPCKKKHSNCLKVQGIPVSLDVTKLRRSVQDSLHVASVFVASLHCTVNLSPWASHRPSARIYHMLTFPCDRCLRQNEMKSNEKSWTRVAWKLHGSPREHYCHIERQVIQYSYSRFRGSELLWLAFCGHLNPEMSANKPKIRWIKQL